MYYKIVLASGHFEIEESETSGFQTSKAAEIVLSQLKILRQKFLQEELKIRRLLQQSNDNFKLHMKQILLTNGYIFEPEV